MNVLDGRGTLITTVGLADKGRAAWSPCITAALSQTRDQLQDRVDRRRTRSDAGLVHRSCVSGRRGR